MRLVRVWWGRRAWGGAWGGRGGSAEEGRAARGRPGGVSGVFRPIVSLGIVRGRKPRKPPHHSPRTARHHTSPAPLPRPPSPRTTHTHTPTPHHTARGEGGGAGSMFSGGGVVCVNVFQYSRCFSISVDVSVRVVDVLSSTKFLNTKPISPPKSNPRPPKPKHDTEFARITI